MDELQYVIHRFGEVFAQDAGKRIILHGTREYAAEIIRAYDGIFHFAGVMTLEDTGTDSFCGKKILCMDDREVQEAEMIILTERVKYAEQAYQALSPFGTRYGIRLMNMYGINETDVHEAYENAQVRDLREWKKLIAPYKAVVFELMDTWFACDGEKYRTRDHIIRMIRTMALNQKKDVLFSLRKSFPEDEQLRMLVQEGIARDIEDAKAQTIIRRGEDLSFRSLSEKYDGRVLYIGTGLVNEFILPRCYGIHTVRYVPVEIHIPGTFFSTGTASGYSAFLTTVPSLYRIVGMALFLPLSIDSEAWITCFRVGLCRHSST